MMNQTLVETRELTKHYGNVVAVDGLNLSVDAGEVYGFLGPNGSGKTTTILMLLGLTEPTSGTARVAGFDPLRDPLQVKRLVGYLPENVGFYDDLTGRQNLRYTGALNRLPRRVVDDRIDQLMEQVGLSGAADRAVAGYSRGMRQRLGIADTLLKQPRVAFLDDPTLGLDPEGVHELLDLIVHMSRDQSITVFLSSHILQQVQRICHRVGIMFRGRLMAEGTVEELSKGAGGGGIRVEVRVEGDGSAIVRALRDIDGVIGVTSSGDRVTIECVTDVRAQVARAIVEQDVRLLELQAVDRTLEDIYMQYLRESDGMGPGPTDGGEPA